MIERSPFRALGLSLLIVSACSAPTAMPIASPTSSPTTIATLPPKATATPTPTPRATSTRQPTATVSALSPTETRIPPTETPGPPTLTAVPPTSTQTVPPTPILPTQPAPTASPLPSSPTPPHATPTEEAQPPFVPTGGRPRISETTLTLATYGYESALIATTPDDPIYPYPRLDHAGVTPAQPRAYRALILENDYVALTILPELGGRIYRWVDKSTGRRLLYENPVVKPTQWGYRGWWLAAGGIEWAFPVEEHGLNEWRPWTYSVSQTSEGIAVTVSDVEDRTGMTVGATVALDAHHSYVTLMPWARNTTESPQRYQFWLNAMVTLGNNRVSGNTRVILPASRVTVHSTGDPTLPGNWQTMSWPTIGGRDLSRYGAWSHYLGFFVPHVTSGFVGLYDEETDQGIVRAFTPGWPAGTKIFGPATLPPSLWTDDGSTYIELWSGATPNFASESTLQPGTTIAWKEQWYPIQGTGGLRTANALAALNLAETGDQITLAAAVSTPTAGTLTLFAGGTAVQTWDITLLPGQAFRTSGPRPQGTGGELGLTLSAVDGTRIIAIGTTP
jgi:hypothetical protein